jgi:hypothetical protein
MAFPVACLTVCRKVDWRIRQPWYAMPVAYDRLQHAPYTRPKIQPQLFDRECVQEKCNFWGYFLIYLSETIGKEEAHRHSEVIVWAGHTNNTVGRSMLPLSYNWKMVVEIYACWKYQLLKDGKRWNMECWNLDVWKKTALKRGKL